MTKSFQSKTLTQTWPKGTIGIQLYKKDGDGGKMLHGKKKQKTASKYK